MARFNMSTKITVADQGVARAALGREKNPTYHHALMLRRIIEVGEATAQELYTWMTENAGQMSEGQQATFKKYSAACHLSYFINRNRGAVKATDVEGNAVAQGPTKVKKAEAPAEAKKEEAPAAPAPATEVVDVIDAALAEVTE
jgi:hypothetical protein